MLLIILMGTVGYVIADYSNWKSTVLLNPIIVDIGLEIITPINLISDIWLENKSFPPLFILAIIIDFLAFGIIILDDYQI